MFEFFDLRTCRIDESRRYMRGVTPSLLQLQRLVDHLSIAQDRVSSRVSVSHEALSKIIEDCQIIFDNPCCETGMIYRTGKPKLIGAVRRN